MTSLLKKIQTKIAFRKKGPWGIITKENNSQLEFAEQVMYALRNNKALTTIVLAVDPSLLYLLGLIMKDLKVIWNALADQFQHYTLANLLELNRKLFQSFL